MENVDLHSRPQLFLGTLLVLPLTARQRRAGARGLLLAEYPFFTRSVTFARAAIHRKLKPLQEVADRTLVTRLTVTRNQNNRLLGPLVR